MNYTLSLMRHAHSEHNEQKENWKTAHNDPNFKTTIDYRQLKYKRELIDARVILPLQIEEAKAAIDFERIQLIICSPLRRCLQTCASLIKHHGGKFKVIVEPLLNSRLSSAWSIGSSVKDLQQEFPLFDFSAFKGVESTWMLTLLENHRKLTAQEIEANAHRSQDFLLEILKSNKGESYHEFQERIRQLKLKVRSTLESHPFADHKKSTVLVISHACVLNYLSAKTFNSEGKVQQKLGFEHCRPKSISLSDLHPRDPSCPSMKAKF